MGARRQGRRTTTQILRSIDQLTLRVGLVESDPLRSLRQLERSLARTAIGIGLLTRTGGAEAAESALFASVEAQLRPLAAMVGDPDAVPPPFSPEIRQRVSYASVILLGTRARLADSSVRLPTKIVLEESAERFRLFRRAWTAFREDIESDDGALSASANGLVDLYWTLGFGERELRVHRLNTLCELLEKVSGREGDLAEDPALVRNVTTTANQLSRPTGAEHREWVRSLLA